MTHRTLAFGATAFLAAALWIVPSVGTRGQGTLGDRFAHPDLVLVTKPGQREAGADTRLTLDRADVLVEAAVAGL